MDLSLDHGISLFDSADIYSGGLSEEILGKALKGKRDRALIATKSTFPMGTNPNEVGSSRHHLIRACEASLKRLQTDHIDVYFMHGFDALTPVDETLRANFSSPPPPHAPATRALDSTGKQQMNSY